MTTNVANVSNVATLIAGADSTRSVAWLTANAAFMIGPAGVTSSTGFPIPANTPFPVESQSAIYGVVASGSLFVNLLEEEQGSGTSVA